MGTAQNTARLGHTDGGNSSLGRLFYNSVFFNPCHYHVNMKDAVCCKRKRSIAPKFSLTATGTFLSKLAGIASLKMNRNVCTSTGRGPAFGETICVHFGSSATCSSDTNGAGFCYRYSRYRIQQMPCNS